MAERTGRSWVIGGLIVYGLAVGIVLLLPVTYSGIVNAIGGWLRTGLGLSFFGFGWVEFFANVLMFLPLGFLLTLLLKRRRYGVGLALLISVGAEVAQIVIPSRQPSLRDILANAIGAAVGALLAWLLVVRRRRRAAKDHPVSREHTA